MPNANIYQMLLKTHRIRVHYVNTKIKTLNFPDHRLSFIIHDIIVDKTPTLFAYKSIRYLTWAIERCLSTTIDHHIGRPIKH